VAVYSDNLTQVAGQGFSTTVENATTNATTDVLTLTHLTTGTPANNIGTGLVFSSEDAGGATQVLAKLRAVETTATAGAEVAALRLALVNSGTVPAEASEQHRWTPGQYLAPDGSASLPGISFASVPAMGLRRNGNDIVFYGGTNGAQLNINDGGQSLSANRLTTFEVRCGNVSGVNETGVGSLNILGGAGSQDEGLRLSIVPSQTKTSGTQTFLRVDNNAYSGGGFAPTSGTAEYRHVNIGYTVNQTGGANGAVNGIYMDSTLTAVGGTHRLMNLRAGGSDYFQVAADLADTETCLLIRRDVGGTETLQRVTMGATDSGGAGFKVLRVPN